MLRVAPDDPVSLVAVVDRDRFRPGILELLHEHVHEERVDRRVAVALALDAPEVHLHEDLFPADFFLDVDSIEQSQHLVWKGLVLLQVRDQRICKIFPILDERASQTAGSLSGGEQEMLAVGRALMSRPKLLILDEPSLGLGPIIVENLFKVLQDINAQGVTILLVEQNAVMALDFANRAYVLENGRVTLSGPSKELARDEKVRDAYLGGV